MSATNQPKRETPPACELWTENGTKIAVFAGNCSSVFVGDACFAPDDSRESSGALNFKRDGRSFQLAKAYRTRSKEGESVSIWIRLD